MRPSSTRRLSRGLVRALAPALLASAALAQNDECATALAVSAGATPFDTVGATLSPEPWPCGFVTAAPDLWFSYVATAPFPVTVETCGANYDSMLQVLSGTCGALVSEACNDDACGLQSRVVFTPTIGATYLIRVGGYNNAAGQGTLTIDANRGPNCLTTTFAGNNQGSVGGAVYFDFTWTQSVVVTGLDMHFTAPAGTPVGLITYITFGSHVGNETNAAAWFPVAFDDGTAVSAGLGALTHVGWASPVVIPAGTFGVCFVAINTAHRYTNGTATNITAMSPDGVVTFQGGKASNVPFTAPLFSPRIWNGSFCYQVNVGASYCGPAVPNSTGASAFMRATGSVVVADDDLSLVASNLPLFSSVMFLASPQQGNWPNPGGSLGNLCLGGAIGRGVGGQVFTTNPSGNVSTYVDLSAMPTPIQVSVPVLPGETYHFQAWYRDNVGGQSASNFTDAITVQFL